jgi:iron complex transport system permease protein
MSTSIDTNVKELYTQGTKRKNLFLCVLFIFLVVVTLVATSNGAAGITVSDVSMVIIGKIIPGSHFIPKSDIAESIVIDIRLPRILLAVLSGIALGGSGVVMQGVLRNPLVSPMTLGVSSGAAFGAALAIVLGASVGQESFAGKYLIVISAFFFGSLTMIMVYLIAKMKGTAPETLLLSGVAFGYLFSAGVSILKYISSNEALKEIVVWLMGGLWGASWGTDLILLPVVLVCTVLLFRCAWDLNIFSAGEDVAISLGVNISRLMMVTLTLATVITSSTIAFTGVVGFVGLIAPHICRMLIGSDHRFLLPCSCLMGAIILLLSDTLARLVLAPVEIPVGIVTSLIGVPFFIYLLMKNKRGSWR